MLAISWGWNDSMTLYILSHFFKGVQCVLYRSSSSSPWNLNYFASPYSVIYRHFCRQAHGFPLDDLLSWTLSFEKQTWRWTSSASTELLSTPRSNLRSADSNLQHKPPTTGSSTNSVFFWDTMSRSKDPRLTLSHESWLTEEKKTSLLTLWSVISLWRTAIGRSLSWWLMIYHPPVH